MNAKWDLVLWTDYLPAAMGYEDGSGAGDGEDGWGHVGNGTSYGNGNGNGRGSGDGDARGDGVVHVRHSHVVARGQQ